MKRLIDIGNGLLLLVAWLYLLPVLYGGLLTGLAPVFAVGLALGWTLGVLAVFRVSIAGPAVWRKLLPLLIAVIGMVSGCLAFSHIQELYIQQHGPLRRYYAW